MYSYRYQRGDYIYKFFNLADVMGNESILKYGDPLAGGGFLLSSVLYVLAK
jgi:hypothetical protein